MTGRSARWCPTHMASMDGIFTKDGVRTFTRVAVSLPLTGGHICFVGEVDAVPFQASVELESGEAEQGSRARLVAVRALECAEDGLPLEFIQGTRGVGRGSGEGRRR